MGANEKIAADGRRGLTIADCSASCIRLLEQTTAIKKK
jgi:hypothetical protein